MIHDWLVRHLGSRLGGIASALVYALMIVSVIHFSDRPAAALAYLHRP